MNPEMGATRCDAGVRLEKAAQASEAKLASAVDTFPELLGGRNRAGVGKAPARADGEPTAPGRPATLVSDDQA